ncbi:uncharacterized protein [Nicotiana sylvestris]|uniref:uncharacterized protein n=1 Tax=Nicotiana sylvestris TaxID=4096 RepID=UPI00388C34EA
MTNDNGNHAVPMVIANVSARRTPALAPTEKCEKYFGLDFKQWQQKMFFYLTTLSLQKFINEDVPVLPDETPENERFIVIEAWNHSDFLCKNYFLSGLEDDLYNVYSGMKTSKELWIVLENKYKTKYVEEIRYRQVFGLQNSLVINEVFQVAAMIEKLSPLWKDFKNYLKHKCKEMSLEDLIFRLRIEEDNKVAEKRGLGNSTIMGGNIIEDTSQNKRKRKQASGLKSNPSKKRFNGNCYNCGKAAHKSTECCALKKHKKKGQANMIEKHEDIDDLCAMLSECKLVGNPKEWWIDSGATRHVCAVWEAFATYAPIGPERLFLWEMLQPPRLKDVGSSF